MIVSLFQNRNKHNHVANDSVIKQVVYALKKRSLTLEECFRAADSNFDGFVSCSEFSQFLSKLKLGISPSIISKLMYILDEDLSGKLEVNEFYNCLAAYKAASENHRNNSRSYEQEILVRFMGIINRRNIDPADIFNMCDTSNDGIITLKELEKFFLGMNVGFQEKEIRSLMAVLDVDNSGEISKDEFFKHMNIGYQAFEIEQFKATKSEMPIETKKTNAWTTNDKNNTKVEWVQNTVAKMESRGLSAAECFEFIETNKEGKVSLANCYRHLAKSFSHLTRDEILRLLTFIDSDKDSIIDISEIQDFLSVYSSNKLSVKQMFSRMAIQIQNDNCPTMAYFSKNGATGTMDLNTFTTHMTKIFKFDLIQCEQLFMSLDLDKQGAVSVKYLAGVIQSYRNDNTIQEDLSEVHDFTEDLKGQITKIAEDLWSILRANNLEPINIFRFADKKNKETIMVAEFQAALNKLIPMIDPKLIKQMEELFPNQTITKTDISELFKFAKQETTETCDQFGLTSEQVFWLKKLIDAIEKLNMTSETLFTAADLNNDGKADIFELKAAMKRCFPGVILTQPELTSILQALDINKNGSIERSEFIQRLQDAETSNHSHRSINEISKQKNLLVEEVKRSPTKTLTVKMNTQNTVKYSPRVAALPLKHINKNNKIMLNILKILSAIGPKTPVYQFFEQMSIHPHSVFNLQRLRKITEEYQISNTDSEELMAAMDTHNKGYVYFYSFFVVLESYRTTMNSFPIPQNPQADRAVLEIFSNICKSFDIGKALFSQLPALNESIGSENSLDFLNLDKRDTDQIKLALPTKAFVYHIATVIQAFQPLLVLSANEIMHCAFDLNRIRSQAPEYFAPYSLNANDVIAQHELNDKLAHALDLRPQEANEIQMFVYDKLDEYRPVYHFFTYFDRIQSMYVADKISMAFPKFPFNTDDTLIDVKNAFQKIANSINEPLTNFGLSLVSLQSESELAAKITGICKINPSILTNYMTNLKTNNNPKIRVYHLIAVLDSYKSEPIGLLSIPNGAFIAINENIPKNISGAEWARTMKIQLGTVLDKSQFSNLFPFLSSNDLSSLFTLIDASNRNFVYMHQLATVIDLAHQTRGDIGAFPFSQNPKTPREVKNVLQENAKHLDTYHNHAYQYYTENRIDAEETIDRSTFLKVFGNEYTSAEANMLYSSLEMMSSGFIKVYHYIACLESCCKSSPIVNIRDNPQIEHVAGVVFNIPVSVSSIEYFYDLALIDLIEKPQVIRYLQNKLQIGQEKALRVYNLIDVQNNDKLFGFQILTTIDLFRSCIENGKIVSEIPQIPYKQNKTSSPSLGLIAAKLDNVNKGTAEAFIENAINITELLGIRDFIDLLTDVPEREVAEIFKALDVKKNSRIVFYHFLAVLESYRSKQIQNKKSAQSKPIQPTIQNSEIQEAIKRLSSYINGQNPQSKPLTASEIFGVFDLNQDRFISIEEFKRGLTILNLNFNDQIRSQLAKIADRDKTGLIDYEEFTHFVSSFGPQTSLAKEEPKIIGNPIKKRSAVIKALNYSLNSFPDGSIEQAIFKLKLYAKNNTDNFMTLESVFKRLDDNNQGILNGSEFNLALERLKLSLGTQQKEALISLADKNRNSAISYSDFIDFIYNFEFETKKEEQKKPQETLQILRSAAKKSDPASEINNYFIVPEKDYFRKPKEYYTTILNSEHAALKRCLELFPKGKTRFIDPDFGPEQEMGGAHCIYWNGKPPSSNYPPPEELKWMSPKEWLPKACFFNDDISSNDVMQGSLGDCWFIGALSVLATKDELLRGSITNLTSPSQITENNAIGISDGVYPPIFHTFAKKGLYVLRFFKDCNWRWVVIDDRLPVFAESGDPKYIFGHCKDPSELWVALIEKAYAKLHGCYESLNGGLIDDGLVDLTGHVAEKFKLRGRGGWLQVPPEQEKTKADLL